MAPLRPVREKHHRLPRERYRGPVAVAITACIADARTAFANTEVVAQCVHHLETAATSQHCFVPVFCFMPEHLHLILQGRDDSADTWAAMVAFKQRSGYWFARNCPTFRWQKDFYDHVIRATEDLHAQVRYIADNPVRRGLVRVWFEYPFTGAIGADLRSLLADMATDEAAQGRR